MRVPGIGRVHSVCWVVVRGDNLPSDDVIFCQEIDEAFAGAVSGEGDPFKSVGRSREDNIPPVSLTLIECVKLSDRDIIGHELSCMFCRIDLLVG